MHIFFAILIKALITQYLSWREYRKPHEKTEADWVIIRRRIEAWKTTEHYRLAYIEAEKNNTFITKPMWIYNNTFMDTDNGK